MKYDFDDICFMAAPVISALKRGHKHGNIKYYITDPVECANTLEVTRMIIESRVGMDKKTNNKYFLADFDKCELNVYLI
jgi:hypothetical protein